MAKCKKCKATLHTCDTCKGQTKKSIIGIPLSCKDCNSTGVWCPTHGGHWK